jgi:hypothetical protein
MIEKLDATDPQAIAEAMVPFQDDGSKKSKYLSYRVTGFTVMESCKLSGCHHKSVLRWREADARFREVDEGDGLSDLRKELAVSYLDLEFTRNFRLVLHKDFEILYKWVVGESLTPFEAEYVVKLRSHYTPQQLAVIKQVLGGKQGDAPFDFTKLTLTLRREKETLEIKSEG